MVDAVIVPVLMESTMRKRSGTCLSIRSQSMSPLNSALICVSVSLALNQSVPQIPTVDRFAMCWTDPVKREVLDFAQRAFQRCFVPGHKTRRGAQYAFNKSLVDMTVEAVEEQPVHRADKEIECMPQPLFIRTILLGASQAGRRRSSSANMEAEPA